MTKIRRLYYFDKNKVKEMISFLNNDDSYINLMFNPFTLIHHMLPLNFKYIPESYVIKESKDIKGIVAIAPSKCPSKQMEIIKLLFEENCYEQVGELIQFVVSKYKAKGTSSIIVRIDDYLPELIKLFVSKCGFNQISYEKLWEVQDINDYIIDSDTRGFREFRNADSSVVANIYNEQLLPHFRPLLRKEANEFKDVLFSGLSYYSEYKYLYIDKNSKNILACLIIKTSDNKNYTLDIIHSSWEDIDINILISFAYSKIKKRTKNANLYIKTKRYCQQSEHYEQQFLDAHFKCVQNKLVLTNSSAKIIQEESGTKKFTVLSQFYGNVGVVNKI